MKQSLAAIFGVWSQPSYERRVRGTVYLWGSATMLKDCEFAKPPILHIRNDPFGELVTVWTQVAAGTQTKIGDFKPGECISIPLNKITCVYAVCDLDSTVGCIIKE